MNPILAVLGLSGGELVMLLCAELLAVGLLVVGVVFVVWLFRRKSPISPPMPQPPLAPLPVVPATDALAKCPQCRQPLPENAPEGLCPACLARVALGTEAAPGATINIDPQAGAAQGTRVPPSAAQLASQFPQLEIIALLGMGGMGMVYKARQPRVDRLVALKILPVESSRGPHFAERFEREAKALAKLNHPGIVTFYDFGQTSEYYYFIMEYVDGMNLRQLLKAKTLEPRQALELVTQICTALQFAHDEGVVHRDIKPENILLNKKGQVKIADFGLAKLLGAAPDTALTMSQAAMGTFNYMAPEQRENAQKVDHRADIYSLGVVFYEMLTGEVPMGRFEPPSKKVQVDVRLDEVVLKALEREPARRYQHASEVKTDVESFSAQRAENHQRSQLPASRNRWPVMATEVAKILGLTALIGFGMYKFDSSWLLALLFLEGWTVEKGASLEAKRWIKAVWVISVIGLSGFGVWISKDAWPVVALLFLFDWGKDKEEEEDEVLAEDKSGPIPSELQFEAAVGDGGAAALPFVIQKRVWGPFGQVSGLMRLEADALALEFEVKSILSNVRKKLREVRIPYKEIVLADFDVLDRLILRTTRTLSLAEVPTSGQGEVTLSISKSWDEMNERAAKRFVAALNRRVAGRLPRSQ